MKYVVIVTRYDGQWVLVRHRERDTYEVPGGHIEPGETPEAAARRELYEESGATEYELAFVSCYVVKNNCRTDGGFVNFADVVAFEDSPKLPDEVMAERRLFEALPKTLTYPAIQPALHKHVIDWLDGF